MELVRLQNNDNYNQILELRQLINAQSRWTFYLNHIVEHIMKNLIDAGKKVNLKYNLRKSDDTKTFKNVCDDFQQFVDFTLNLYNQVQKRGGFKEIDENIKKFQAIITRMESPQFKKDKKANDIIQNLIGEDYNPDDLKQIFATNQKQENSSLTTVENPLAEKKGTDITSDNLQVKSEISANKSREEFPNSYNNQEILDQLKKELNHANQKLADTNKELETKTKSLEKAHKQLEDIFKAFNIELPSSENLETKEQEFSEEQLFEAIEKVKKVAQTINNNENEELNIEQIKERQENHDKICQQLSETKKQLQSKSEEIEKTQTRLNEILHALNINNENTEDPMTDEFYSSFLKKVKELNNAAHSSSNDGSKDQEKVKLESNNHKTTSNELIRNNDCLLNDLNKTRDQLNEFVDIFSNNKKEKDDKKQTNSDEENKINEPINDEENKINEPINDEENKINESINDEENKINEPINDEEFEPLIKIAKKDRDISTYVQKILPEHSSSGEEASKEIKNLQLNTSNLQSQLRNLATAIEGIEEQDDQELTESRIEEDISKVKKENKIMDIIENVLLNPSKETKDEEETKLEAENQEINKSIELEPEQVADKINYLNDRSVELDNANQNVSSLTQELEQAKQQLENRTKELVDTQKQLMSVYDVVEVIQGRAVNPEELTPEKLEEIIIKARKDKELIDSIELYHKSPHKNDSDSTNSIRSRSQDYFKLIHQLEEFVSIYGPSDENGNKIRLEELNDEEFTKMIETARKNKKVLDAFQSSLSQSNSSSPDEVEKKIKSLESRSNELDRITNQFSQVLNAIGTIEEESSKTSEKFNNNNQQQQKDEDNDTKLFDAKDISNEQLSCFISKAKKSNEITSVVNKNLPDHSSTGEEVENALIDLKSRSLKLDKIVLVFDEVLNAIRGNKNEELKTENNEEIRLPSSINISDEELLQVIADARRAKEITNVVEKTIPDHSSTAEDVEVAINAFKSRSEELDEVYQKLDIKSSDFEKLRSHLNTLFSIYNSKQNDNDEFIDNEKLIDSKNNNENTNISNVKNRNVNNEKIEEEEEGNNDPSYAESITTTTKSSNKNLENSFNETNNDSNVDETNKDQVSNLSKDFNKENLNRRSDINLPEINNQLDNINETNKNQDNKTSKLSKHFNNENPNRKGSINLQEINNQLDNVDENSKDQDNKSSKVSNHFSNENPNRKGSTNLQEINNHIDNTDETSKDQKNKKSKVSNHFSNENPNRRSNINLPEMSNQLDNVDETNKDQDNKTFKLNKQSNNENFNRISNNNLPKIGNQLENHDENISQHYDSDIRSEESNLDDKIADLVEKVKRSKDITTVVVTSFPEDSENAEQVESKITKLKNQSVQLDGVSKELEEKSAKLELARKQLKEVAQAFHFNDDEQMNIEDMTEEDFTNFVEQVKKENEIMEHLNKQNNNTNNKGVDIIRIQKTLNDFDRSVAHLKEFIKIFDDDDNCNVDEITDDYINEIINKAKKESDMCLAVKVTLPNHSSCSEEVKATVKILKLRSAELDKVKKQLKEFTAELQRVRMQLNSMMFSNFSRTSLNPAPTTDPVSYMDPSFDSHDYLSNNDFAYF